MYASAIRILANLFIFTKHFVNTSKIAKKFDGSQENTMSYRSNTSVL